ncbi:MAG: hypothetical protein GXP24_03540 [Planctomycetes bacterium]|nr:hypothetical protein [Planctomycetota bacterium]
MKVIRRVTAFLATLTAITLTGQATVQAEDLSYSDLVTRITALESDLQKTSAVQLASCTGDANCGFATSCRPSGCDSSAWYFGYELTALQPYVSDAALGAGSFDDDFGFGHRLTLGYDGGSGMGARLRYWFYNTGLATVPPAAQNSLGIDMDVIDLELNLTEQLRNFNFMISGGVRYARLGLNSTLISTAFPRLVFEGGGPTAALEATRAFGDRGLYLIGNVRGSLLFGDLVYEANKWAGETTVVFENQFGVGMTRNLGRATLNLRTVWETQVWLNDTLSDSHYLGSNLGFGGPTSSIELRF